MSNSKIHKLNIINNRQMPFLQYIANGIKKAEGRIATEYVKTFKIGDKLKLEGNGEYTLCEITFLDFYKNFEEMLLTEGLKNMLPFVDNIEDGIKIYTSFPGAKRVKEMGCCAIGIKSISSNLSFELKN